MMGRMSPIDQQLLIVEHIPSTEKKELLVDQDWRDVLTTHVNLCIDLLLAVAPSLSNSTHVTVAARRIPQLFLWPIGAQRSVIFTDRGDIRVPTRQMLPLLGTGSFFIQAAGIARQP